MSRIQTVHAVHPADQTNTYWPAEFSPTPTASLQPESGSGSDGSNHGGGHAPFVITKDTGTALERDLHHLHLDRCRKAVAIIKRLHRILFLKYQLA
jgi:hypothetical protein